VRRALFTLPYRAETWSAVHCRCNEMESAPNMTAVEDDTLDRRYAESGQDPSCVLLSCSRF
jgi:hypothetical protein